MNSPCRWDADTARCLRGISLEVKLSSALRRSSAVWLGKYSGPCLYVERHGGICHFGRSEIDGKDEEICGLQSPTIRNLNNKERASCSSKQGSQHSHDLLKYSIANFRMFTLSVIPITWSDRLSIQGFLHRLSPCLICSAASLKHISGTNGIFNK